MSPLTMLAPHSLPRHSLLSHHGVATAAALRWWSRSSPPPPRTTLSSSIPSVLPLPLLSPLLSNPFPSPDPLPPGIPLSALTPALLPPLINSSHMPSNTHSEPIAATYHNSASSSSVPRHLATPKISEQHPSMQGSSIVSRKSHPALLMPLYSS